jgi:hypothetical protein
MQKITSHNEENSKALVPLFQEFEFITGLAIMIGAACYKDQGIPFVSADCHLFLCILTIFVSWN